MSQATRTVELDATLTDINGNPLPGKTINFYYRESGSTEWTQIGSQTTDQNGKATMTYQLPPGTYDFRAEFPGDETYAPSDAEVDNVSVERIQTKLTLVVKVVG